MLYASKRCIHRPTWWCVFTKWWRELNVDSCRQFELQLSFNNFYIFDQLFWWYIVNQLYASIRLSILYMRTYFSAIFRRAYGVKLLEQSRSETFFFVTLYIQYSCAPVSRLLTHMMPGERRCYHTVGFWRAGMMMYYQNPHQHFLDLHCLVWVGGMKA